MDWRGRQLSDYIQTALFVLISVSLSASQSVCPSIQFTLSFLCLQVLSLAIGILKEDVTLVFKSSVAGCALVILVK